MPAKTKTDKQHALDAAVAVLAASDKPMDWKDIQTEAKAKHGVNPDATYAALYGNYKKDGALVTMVAKRTFALTPAGQAKADPSSTPPPVEEVTPADLAHVAVETPAAVIEQPVDEDSPAVTPGTVVLADPLKQAAKPDPKPKPAKPAAAPRKRGAKTETANAA